MSSPAGCYLRTSRAATLRANHVTSAAPPPPLLHACGSFIPYYYGPVLFCTSWFVRLSVCKAFDRSSGVFFAAKRLEFSAMDVPAMKVLAKEIRMLKDLRHPNIVSYRGYDLVPDVRQLQHQFGPFLASCSARCHTRAVWGVLHCTFT